MKRVLAIARKEVLHVLRDPRSLLVSILWPMLMVLLLGYAIDMELRDLPVGILDEDRSDSSRDLIREMTASGFIVDAVRLSSRDRIEPGFRRLRFRAALIIPKGYSEQIATGPTARVQLLIDGADGATAATVDNYLAAVVARVNRKLAVERFGDHTPPIEARTRFYYNPELRSANFIVPGLAAVVMIMICALLTSISVTREKETGTIEQVLTAPVTARQVMIGKVLPFLVIASLDAFMILLVGRFIFGVPMNGSWFVLACYSLIYLMIALAIGLLISAVAKTQQVAMMLAIVVTMLPAFLLSGFIFPRESMPLVLQWISSIVPATYYIPVIRGVMLAGESWFPLEGGVMLAMALLLMAGAIGKFKLRLE